MTCSTARSASSSRPHKARGDLNLTPLKFTPEMERPSNGPLLFPGKVLADPAGKRLFIADTGHNRIIQTDLEGAEPVTIGSGEEGFDDGDYREGDVQPAPGDVPGRRDALRRRHRKPRDPRRRSQGAHGDHDRGHRQPGPRHSAPGAFGPAKTTPLCSPWDVIQLAGRQGALYRHGRHPPDLEARPRLGNGQCVRRIRR